MCVDDIQFGDLDAQAEPRYLGEKSAQEGGGKRRSARAYKMSLNAYRVDRRPGSLHLLEQIEKRSAAGFVLWYVQLETMVVHDETR